MSVWRLSILIAVTINLLIAQAPKSPVGKSKAQLRVYVDLFKSHTGISGELRRSFTKKFERELGKLGVYSIVEIGNPTLLLLQLRQVPYSVEDLEKNEKDNLQENKIDAIVLGEVEDKVESGQITVTARLVKWDGSHWEHLWNVETSIRRGLLRDDPSQTKAMKELAAEEVIPKSMAYLAARVERATMEIQTFTHRIAAIRIDVRSCRRLSARDIECLFAVSNDGERRRFGLRHDDQTYVHMNDDYVGKIVGAKLAQDTSDDGYSFIAELMFAKQAELVVQFRGVSSTSRIVTFLQLNCWEADKGTKFLAEFANIPLS